MASTARLDELKKKFDENPRRYFAPLANEHRKSGNLDQAIALCRAHLPQQPAHISGHIVLGQALFEAGELDESRATFLTALELDPENLIALRYLGDIARNGGDVSTARSWYQRVLDVDPRNDEIEQLLRELDSQPEAEPAEVGDIPDVSAFAPSAGATPADAQADAPPAFDHSRFAPLTLDQIDTDSELFAPAGEPARASSTTDAEALDAKESSRPEAPMAETPMLDFPELDPFETHADAGADTLLSDEPDAARAMPSDPLLDDLTVSNDSNKLGDLEAAPEVAPNAWAANESPEPQSSSATAPVPEFDDSAFYLEPAPGAAADSASAEDWAASAAPSEPVAAEQIDEHHPAARASDDAASSHEADEWDIEPATAFSSAAPNASASDAVAANPAAEEPEPFVPETVEGSAVAPAHAAVAPEDVLGLEVMEFVPPAPAPRRAGSDAPTDADPLVGHMPELTAPTASGATPDAFVTETMAELYLQQGFRNEALGVYRELLARNPADTSLRERIEQIESGSMSSIGMAMLSENVVESARKRQTERPTRSVRSFFAALAGRRAPYAPPRESAPASGESDDDAAPPPAAAPEWGDEASAALSAEPAAEHEQAAPGHSFDPGHSDAPATPPTAAEQMATFDPFADAWSAPSPTAGAEPNEPPPVGDEPPRSLEGLFPESAPTPPRADAAAQTLATAFGRTEPQGRPTRAASNELSLDRVFRGAPEGPPPTEGGFSFDQFFSDARTSGADATATPQAPNAPEGSPAGEGGGDTHDIEQFTAWLEGLKKK